MDKHIAGGHNINDNESRHVISNIVAFCHE